MKKSIIISIILLGIIVFYMIPEESNNNLNSSNINNNLDRIAFYVQTEEGSEEYNSLDTIPSKDDGYVFKEAVCSDSSTVTFNSSSWSLKIGNMEDGRVRCRLYFDIDTAIAREYILAQNTINEGTPDFSTTATTNEGIFMAEDDYGTSYYYRGDVDNNYFYFAGYYWRIIRINGDGTIRLIYQGTSANASGNDTQFGTSIWTSASNDNAYVGYMYGSTGASSYEETHSNTNDSTIKTTLDDWYETNLASYSNLLADTGFCGDRSLTSGTGIGTTTTYYGAYGRLVNSKEPSFKCVNENDLYTTSTSNVGNGALTNPIGLITADEVAYAGGVSSGTSGTSNTSYYLYTGTNYKIMTPYAYFNDSGTTRAVLFGVDTNGVLRRFSYTNQDHGVRPVINLDKDIELEGTGTSSEPYRIAGTKMPSASDVILAGKDIQTRNDFSTVLSTNTNGIIFEEQISDGTTYYFAGDTDENWVSFAGYYWRIIRINEDGSIRMIYNGTTTDQTGTGTQIQASTFNNSFTNNMYVGYMYQSNQVHGLTNNSTIKGIIDEWYEDNIQGTSEEDSISHEAGFCGDRTPSTSDTIINGNGGTGTRTTYYGARIRLYADSNPDNASPSFECINDSDLFTTSGSSKGNRALDYPVGLITADEVAYAGGMLDYNNMRYYLYTNTNYWTMSPSGFISECSVFYVHPYGTIYGEDVNVSKGVRPVINLKPDVTLLGTGTTSDPYTVS